MLNAAEQTLAASRLGRSLAALVQRAVERLPLIRLFTLVLLAAGIVIVISMHCNGHSNLHWCALPRTTNCVRSTKQPPDRGTRLCPLLTSNYASHPLLHPPRTFQPSRGCPANVDRITGAITYRVRQIWPYGF